MKYALLVGINTFEDKNANLNGCVNDVMHVRSVLVNNGWDPTNIRLLCDQRATRQEIYRRLEWLTNVAHNGDTVFIQFSTHGTQIVDRDGDELNDYMDECLCSYDFVNLWNGGATKYEDASYYKGILGTEPRALICDDDIAIMLKKFDNDIDIVMLVDACHSGTVSRNPSSNRYRFVRPPIDIAARAMDRVVETRRFGLRKNKQLVGDGDIKYIEQNHVLLSGCRDNQTSADAFIDNTPQGAMTWAFIRSIKSNPKASFVEIHASIVNMLSINSFNQVPQLCGSRDRLGKPVFV